MSRVLTPYFLNEEGSPISVCSNTKEAVPKVLQGLYTSRLFQLLIALLLVPMASLSSYGQCTLTCDDQKNISLSNKGLAVIYPELILNGDFSCAAPIEITILDENNQPINDTITCEYIGRTLQVGARSESLNLDCWSTIVIEDKFAPRINCSDTIISCSSSTLPSVLGFPTIFDNCQTYDSTDLRYFDLYTELACGATHDGIAVNARITRSWTLLDDNGNVGTCTQNIYLRRNDVQSIVFPSHRDDINGPAISCTADNPSDVSNTGEPTINGEPIRNGDACKLFVSHQDQLIEVCPPASYRIIRRWEVTDICTQEVRVGIQNILIVDRNAPIVSCPDSFTVNTNLTDCSASVILPQAVAIDSCSDVTVQPEWAFGTGYGPFFNVPIGTHSITYKATDKCGNASTCTTVVTIVDNSQPAAICRDQVNVALSNNGFTEVPAAAFDGGSRDNCGIVRWEVSRDTIFGESVQFTCADINNVVRVRLRVYDEAGLNNECSVDVIVNDEAAPILICPPNITLNCSIDYRDTSITGYPTVIDNCGIQQVSFTDTEDFNACNIGTVTRTWIAIDSSGNNSTCQQFIFLEDQTPITVTFPADYTTSECGADLSPNITGEPVVTGSDCENMLVSFEDEVFLIGDSACMKILRTWSVLDWCAFDPSDTLSGGRFVSTQLIKVIDENAPIITSCPTDITVGITEAACETRVDLPDLIATDCNANLTISNTSLFADENGANASGIYPIGTHTVQFVVSDGCGNVTNCQMAITVEDAFAPTPVCRFGLSIPLTADGTVVVPPNAINSGSFDNCSDPSTLIYEISPNFFTCDDIGVQTVNLIVTDEAGNSQFCLTDIHIQDNGDFCNPNSMTSIGGKVFMEDGNGMEAVNIHISGGIEEMGYTDLDGNYLFENLSRTETYTIRPVPNEEYREGISTFDLVLIRKHILGLSPLPSPYKILAADVNNSKTITAYDMVIIRQLVLGTRNDFPNNPSWRFIDASYEFPDPRNPFMEEIPEFRAYKQLLINDLTRDFIGIKIGDVNNSASPTAMVSGSRNANERFTFHVSDLDLEAGKTYTVPIKASALSKIQGYQFTIEFDRDKLDFEEILPNSSLSMGMHNFGLHRIEEGLISTSWENIAIEQQDEEPVLFSLVFKTKQAGNLKNAIHFNSTITEAEAYTQEGLSMDIDLAFSTKKATKKLELYQNFPNPFEGTTIISFSLPEASEASLHIYDLNGKLLKSYYGKYAQGYNEIEVDLSELHIKTGVLYYHLQTPSLARLSKKMVFISK